MNWFNIGDAVYLKKVGGTQIFMVVDFLEYQEFLTDEVAEDKDYEIMQIYPVQEDASFEIVKYDELAIHSRLGSVNNEMLHHIIKKDREDMGLYGVPDFVRIANDSRDFHESKIDKSIVDYTTFKTIDECLDVINDLNMLHDAFGDKEYLDSKEIVIKRMKEIQKLELMSK